MKRRNFITITACMTAVPEAAAAGEASKMNPELVRTGHVCAGAGERALVGGGGPVLAVPGVKEGLRPVYIDFF